MLYTTKGPVNQTNQTMANKS